MKYVCNSCEIRWPLITAVTELEVGSLKTVVIDEVLYSHWTSTDTVADTDRPTPLLAVQTYSPEEWQLTEVRLRERPDTGSDLHT